MSMSGGSLRSAREEALEQHVHRAGSTSVMPSAIADRRVGGRAAALAEDLPAAGEADDVVHGQEVGLVVAARRSAPARARSGRGPCRGAPSGQRQRTPSSVRWRSQVAGGVARAAPVRAGSRSRSWSQREVAALRRCARVSASRSCGIDRRQRAARAQVALAVGEQQARRPRPRWCGGGSRSACPAARRRARTCMCTSPAATSGRPWRWPSSRSACRRASSSGPRCSSTAIHRRSANSRLQPCALAASAHAAGSHNASRPTGQSIVEILAQQPVLALARAARRATVISRHSAA